MPRRHVVLQYVHQQTGEALAIDVSALECPTCGSTAGRCERPSGHWAAHWHDARELLLAPLVGMPRWQPRA